MGKFELTILKCRNSYKLSQRSTRLTFKEIEIQIEHYLELDDSQHKYRIVARNFIIEIFSIKTLEIITIFQKI